MQSKGEQTKAKILSTALDLMESQGFHNTGIQQIIKSSGMPKGSLYFHFPEGKDQIAALALENGALMINTLLDQAFTASKSPKQAIGLIIQGLSQRLESSAFNKGCPIATVALEVANDHPIVHQACETAYNRWTDTIAKGLINYGFSKAQAKREASLALSMIEGALILAKVRRELSPLTQAGKAMSDRLAQLSH